ncbi:helix-turn-helix domain-containing protein [Acetobacterium sp.]|uniref:helix-turn-helix domain-containing protein n=1 Tax=Acetobacterium sp. TaxID=1872094 RepID=UPI00271A67AD|nr:helix-turn-helix transcriptional regulator [Acetobacterium sp.]MDO9490792.1 helix-turn-helix transcriptional regulator [Acetobacterium sp.]
MDIGSNIKKIRKSKGITQTALAKNTGIPYRTLQDYENNKIKEPAVSKLTVIATKLGVTLGELTGETEVLKNELRLKDIIATERNLIKDLSLLKKSLSEIEDKIKNENDPEILRTLPEQYNAKKFDLNLWSAMHKNIESEINTLCKTLGTTKEDFIKENIIDEKKSDYIDLLVIANKQVNSLVKDDLQNENRIFERIVSGDLENFQKLFTDRDIVFFCQAMDSLIYLKKLIENKDSPYLPLAVENLRHSLKLFFSNDSIGMDVAPENIDDLFETLSKGFQLNPPQ